MVSVRCVDSAHRVQDAVESGPCAWHVRACCWWCNALLVVRIPCPQFIGRDAGDCIAIPCIVSKQEQKWYLA